MPSQLDLIDVSEEDDSLLPAGNKATHRNDDDSQKPSGYTGCTAEAADAIQNDNLLSQQVSEGMPEEPGKLALPVMTKEPVLVKKKKTNFNVRKSLAWNNAFFTEEGVLDSEELSLVNRTFQKPLGLPKPSTFKRYVQSLKPANPPMMPKINLTSQNAALTAERKENQIVSAVISPSSSTDSLIERSLSKSSGQHINNIKGPSRLMSSVIAPISLANVQMDTSKKEKVLVEALANSSESTLLLRRSLEKKNQGSSLPGINHHNGEDCLSVVETDSNVRVAMASGSVSSKGATNLKQIAKDGKSLSQFVNKEPMRKSSRMKLTGDCISLTAVSRAQPAPSSMTFISETATTKTQCTTQYSKSYESGTSASREKPSGLRMPSPKLGFFDMNRTASQVAVPRERTGHGSGATASLERSTKDAEIVSSRYTTNPNQGLKHPAASAKPSHRLLEASRKQTIESRSSSGIPSAPRVHGPSAGIASMRVASVHDLSRSVSYPSNRVNKKVDDIEQVLQPRKHGQNGCTQGKPVQSNSTVRNVPGQENLSPDCKDGKICAIEAVQKCQGFAPNVVKPSQKSVSQLLPSMPHILLGQVNVEESMEEVVVSQNQNRAESVRTCI